MKEYPTRAYQTKYTHGRIFAGNESVFHYKVKALK